MFRKLCALTLVAVMAVPSVSHAKFFSFGLNEQQVKDVVKNYLTENPEVITQAIEAARIKQEEMKQEAVRQKLNAHRAELEQDPTAPVLGNPNGDVTVVEFFDYNCGYCKMMFPKVMEAVQNDGNIRWVLKDLPTLGPISRDAALAGLAAENQGKFFEMHQALMTHKGALSKEEITKFAESAGLDMAQFNADIASPALAKILDANRALANQFEINGVPQFIIGDYMSNGAMMGDELKENVTKIRSQK